MTKRNRPEKIRDILELFLFDETAFSDFRRRVVDARLTEFDWNKIKEFLPSHREEPLTLSDNYIREHARLGSKEAKKYIEFLFNQMYLQRDEDGALEMTPAGKTFYEQLARDLATEQASRVRQLDEYLGRKTQGGPTA